MVLKIFALVFPLVLLFISASEKKPRISDNAQQRFIILSFMWYITKIQTFKKKK